MENYNELNKMLFTNMNMLPKPISYDDIDAEVTKFVSEKFSVFYKKSEIRTFFFSHQRMSEFTKTWELVDDDGNVIPNNFKIVSRENNPKKGTMMGGFFNIPGDHLFDLGIFEKIDGQNKKFVRCKMRQPYCVDIIYNIKFVSNKLYLINELNSRVNDEFKSRQSYIKINNQHFMPVVLEDIDDESDYDLEQRKILTQNYKLKVMAYIINENDIIYEDVINRVLLNTDIDMSKQKNFPLIQNNSLVIDFPRKSKKYISFKSNASYAISDILKDDNITSYSIKLNNADIVGNSFVINKYDNVSVSIERDNVNQISSLKFVFQ